MPNSDVAITDITGMPLAELEEFGARLGAIDLKEIIDKEITHWNPAPNKILHLQWEGDILPSGASIDDKLIGSIRNGQVMDFMGDIIGICKRLVNCGGANNNEQQLLVFVL